VDTFYKLTFFVLMLGGLIISHELGHYIAATLLGIRVREFGLGLPPRLLKLGEWRGTLFSLNAVPLGGFVRPEGEFDPAVPNGLAAAAPWKRIVVFAAGPLVNVVVGFMVLIVGFMVGWPDRVRVIDVMPDSPAAQAGLRFEDVLVKVNEVEIHDPRDWSDAAYANLGQAMRVEVERGGAPLVFTLTPDTTWSPTQRPTGLSVVREMVQYPFFTAVQRAVERVMLQLRETVALPVRAITQQLKPNEARLTGLLGLKQVSDRIVENAVQGQILYPVLNLIALISVALGFTNLLPIAALDGGRIAFAVLEIVRGKPFNARYEKMIHAAGMVAILSLMVVLIVQDYLHPIF